MPLTVRADHHTIYSGRALLIMDRRGWIGKGTEGYYFDSTRFLSRDALEVKGEPLEPSGVSTVGHDALLGYYVASRAGTKDNPVGMATLERFVSEGMAVTLRLDNHSLDTPLRFDLAWHLDADFADFMEAQAGSRRQQAEVERTWNALRGELRLRYLHPDLPHEVTIRVEQAPQEVQWASGALHVPVAVGPREQEQVRLSVRPIVGGEKRRVHRSAFARSAPGTSLAAIGEQVRAEAPRLSADNATVEKAWATAVDDLASLPLGLESGPAAPMAGLPVFHDFYGRDSLTIGWQALLAMPALLRDSLRASAAWRGRRIDDFFDEEPGKLFNHVRRGPLSLLRKDPFAHYHGDYAAGADFLIGFGQYLAWTNDRNVLRELLPAAREVLEWSERYADVDGDGFIEYVRRSDDPQAVKNQGWKDSPEAILDVDGRALANPIASCELQGYLYAGLRQTAQAFLFLGERGYALDLLKRAARLKRRFNEVFWLEDEGYYALALGPDKRPVRTVTSNPGHLLATGIVPRERAARVVRRLMQDDLFSGWGVRTLSDRHPAYNPFGYHLGSVWPVESATIALGMVRYGFWREAHQLAEGLFAASELFESHRPPEAFGGLPRDAAHPHPGVYPAGNSPQGWSASAVVMMIQVLLGMRPMAPLRSLLIDPQLPEWLPRLALRGARVGRTRLDVTAWRDRRGATRVRLARHGGRLIALHAAPARPTFLSRLLTGRARW